MPSTINGIGTTYYSRRNVVERPGVCEHCGRPGRLSSHDTILWFTIFFIPILPLGRKRILDYCPTCTRHHVMPLRQWEELRRTSIQEGIAAARARPDDPEAALALHATLISVGQIAEADQQAALLQKQFPNSALVFSTLGGAMDFLGRHAEGVPLHERALQLDPARPSSRIAVALDRIGKGRLDEARDLLRFLESPEAAQAPGALLQLARAYVQAGRPAEAEPLLGLLLQHVPNIGKDPAFRKTMRQAEKALGTRTSRLPAAMDAAAWRKVAIAAGVILALGAGFVLWNAHLARNRLLHVVSGFEAPVTVQIDHRHTVVLKKPGYTTLRLPEGRHHARISGPVNEEATFDLKGGFFSRMGDRQVFILNAGRSALLVQERTLYSTRPDRDSFGGMTFHYDRPFYQFNGVDYVFREFPKQITLDSSTSKEWRSRVGLLESPAAVFFYLANNKKAAEAMTLMEWHLRLHPEQDGLLAPYLQAAALAKRETAALNYLREACRRRPIAIAWHRAFQHLAEQQGELNELRPQYDALLKAEPDSSALLYLRGRLGTRVSESRPYYEAALNRDPANAYAHYAMGVTLAGEGRWPEARAHLAQAVEQRPDDAEMSDMLFQARMAVGDTAALERELRASVAREPGDMSRTIQLCQVLVARKQTADIATVKANLKKQLSRDAPDQVEDGLESVDAVVLYGLGDLEGLDRLIRKNSGQPGILPLIELGRLAEAGEAITAQTRADDERDGILDLTMAVAHAAAGDETPARTWMASALARFEKCNDDRRIVGELLARPEPPSPGELEDYTLVPRLKAILLVALAQKHPARRTEFLTFARRLNVTQEFPYHLLNRVIKTGLAPQPTGG